MSAEHEEEEFHSGEEEELNLDDDEIVLGARRAKASDDEESVDGDDDAVPAAEPLDGTDAAGSPKRADDGGALDREPLDVNLPDDLNEGDLGAGDRKSRPKPRPKFEPYVVPTSGAFYMHDDRFDEAAEVEKPRRGPRKVDENDRWKHDKFETLENGPSDDEESAAHFGFRNRGRGRGRGRGAGRRGYGGGYRGNGQGPPPGFEDSSARSKRGRPHPAEALREAEPYEADVFGPPPSLNPDAQPFRAASSAQAQDSSFGGSLDPTPAGSQLAGQGSKGRGGGRRYSAMAGNLRGDA